MEVVRSGSDGGGGGGSGGARQLAIEGGAVAVVVMVLMLVARVSLEGESTADRVESDVAGAGGVVDLRLRRRIARQSH